MWLSHCLLGYKNLISTFTLFILHKYSNLQDKDFYCPFIPRVAAPSQLFLPEVKYQPASRIGGVRGFHLAVWRLLAASLWVSQPLTNPRDVSLALPIFIPLLLSLPPSLSLCLSKDKHFLVIPQV